MAEGLTSMIKENLLQYGQSYLNFDYQHATKGKIEVNAFPFFVDFYYKNLKHDPIKLDMQAFRFNFTHMEVDNEPVVYMRLPLIENWGYRFNYKYSLFGIGFGGEMEIDAKNIDAVVTFSTLATDTGYLYPQLHDIVVDFGDSKLSSDGSFMQFWYRQLFNISKYVTMNAMNVFGKAIINKQLP